ncbi:MAG TPA: glycosyltransferase family 4 protein [Thermoanaerobaculia bacterium]|nr:glycosyltransferase family 4 protein [Thermoanaerobaculia bacterium]
MSVQDPERTRLAVVVSHAIQYFSPWFAHIARRDDVALRVFYLWDFGVQPTRDREFGVDVQWDIPLLSGYEFEYAPNRSRDPGTHHFFGLDNPGLAQRIAAWSPDAILMFGYAYASHLRLLLSPKLWRVPLLLRGDSHDLSRGRGIRPVAARIARRALFRRFAAFLPVGKANMDYYRRSGVADRKMYFAPHAVDIERFAAADPMDAAKWRRATGIPDDAAVVMFAGKFEPNKRPLDLLRAFLLARPDRAVLLMVGSGRMDEELRAAAGPHLGRDVFFAPFQNQSTMPLLYAAADLFVLPSMNETWGLAVNEAMSASRAAVVSSRAGCVPDLIREGETGWTFEPGDVDALARTIREALSDRQRLRAVGRAAREHISRYSYEAATEGLLAALHAVT